jgi:hypothetical protein
MLNVVLHGMQRIGLALLLARWQTKCLTSGRSRRGTRGDEPEYHAAHGPMGCFELGLRAWNERISEQAYGVLMGSIMPMSTGW